MDNNDVLFVPAPHDAGHVGNAPPVITVFSLSTATPSVSELKNGPLVENWKASQ
jgi:hypothetical protein